MERIRTKNRECIGRRRQGRCHPRIGTAVSVEPLPLELAHPEEQHARQYGALRLLSSTGGRCRNQGTSWWTCQFSAEASRRAKATSKAKGGDGKDDKKEEGENGIGKDNAKATEYFVGYCLQMQSW